MSTNHFVAGQQTFLPERECLLNEYSQAVHSYQKVVLELREAREDGSSGQFWNLLAEADTAKHTLEYCRDRYLRYCTPLKQTEQ